MAIMADVSKVDALSNQLATERFKKRGAGHKEQEEKIWIL